MLALILTLLLAVSAAGQTIPRAYQPGLDVAEDAAFRRLQLHDAIRLRELAQTAKILELKIQMLEDQLKQAPPPLQQPAYYATPSPAEQERRIYEEGVARLYEYAEAERRAWSKPIPASYNPPPHYVPPPPTPEEERQQAIEKTLQDVNRRYGF